MYGIVMQVGDIIPAFSVTSMTGETVTHDTIRGRRVIFYFYPKDDTPGCTTEGKDFSDALPEFEKYGVDVYGISKCSVKKHQSFCRKYDFAHTLLSDDTTLCEDFGVWVEKKMYGRTYMGIERSTFVIDANGVITHMWRNVSVPGHVQAVLDACC